MKRALPFCALLAALGLSACDDSTSNGIALSVPKQPGGAYTVLASGDSLNFGEAFYDASGNAFLVLSSDDRTPAGIMFTVENGKTSRVPVSTKDIAISYSSTASTGYNALDPGKLGANYLALVGGESVAFAVDAAGKMTAGSSACKLSGSLDGARRFGPAVAVSLSFSGCAGVSGSYSGVAFARADMAPASFRVVAVNATQIVDFMVYP